MAFCSNCGKELLAGAKFCFECGTPVKVDTTSQRKSVYEGEIHKCPNCGEVINSFVSICPACGFEFNSKRILEYYIRHENLCKETEKHE